MDIHILHLYYDLLNLYGEYGNIQILKKELVNQNLNVIIDRKTINDDIDFSIYQFIYIGSGTEKNILLASKDLLKYKEDIKKLVDNEVVILATGNSSHLFGTHIIDMNKVSNNMLGVFEYYTEYLDKRLQTDVISKCNFLDNKIVGFINTQGVLRNNGNKMFDIEFSNSNITEEGILFNNFYGTSILGPIFSHNPDFLNHIVKLLLSKIDKEYKEIESKQMEYINLSYENILNELTIRSKNK